MSDSDAPQRPKKLEFKPSGVLLNAFNKFMQSEGHTAESKALEALAREGLQARGLLPGKRQQV